MKIKYLKEDAVELLKKQDIEKMQNIIKVTIHGLSPNIQIMNCLDVLIKWNLMILN